MRGTRERSRAPLALVALLLTGLSVWGAATPAAAALSPGQIDHAELATSLRNQGLGGPIVVTATLYLGADPHRLLYAENLALNLSLPDGLRVTDGENPRVYAAFPIPASAQYYQATFAWTINSTRVGDFRLNLAVTSTSAGSADAFTNISVRVGPVFGKVNLQPGSPTTSTPLVFAVPVATGFDDPQVLLNVTLYVYQTTESIKPASATNNTLKLSNADRSWNFVLGTPLRMSDAGGGNFVYNIPPIARGALIYWVYAEARLSNGTVLGSGTTSPIQVFIQDPGVTAAVYWGAFGAIAAVFAACLYAMFYDPRGRKAAVGALHNSPDRVRFGLALVAVGATVFMLAFLTGAAVGLWRWFGYL